MYKRPQDLPDFDKPPLDEVALSVQFNPIPGLQTAQIGLLWSKFRKDFPKTEQHPPLDPLTERFGPPTRPSVHLELATSPPAPRCWFLREDGSELIQIQQDRFIHNWRKLSADDSYPRYEHVRQQFQSELEIFCDFLNKENVGEFLPNQCEVTYINAVLSGKGWERHGQLGQILSPINAQYSDGFLGEPESVRLAMQYIIPDESGNPMGRLHFSASPAFKSPDNIPLYLLNVTARGAPRGKGIADIIEFMDMGREWIVRGFTSITTPQMHTIWERKDASKSGLH